MRHLIFILLLCLRAPGAWAEPLQDSNLHMQATSVAQDHGPFRSPYQGQNSLQPIHESDTSLTWTIFAGHRLWKDAEVYVNPELVGGSGISKTLGVAGYPNGEIYRVDDPSAKWSLSRLYVKQTVGLGDEEEEVKDDKNQLAGKEKVRRVTLALGKFALSDFFDGNAYSHDPRTQFLNWSLMDNGAWDYAADTRGYSWGLYLELNQPNWSLRWATVMVPLKANQMEMDQNFPAHRSDNLEFEYRYTLREREGAVRVMAYNNIANMGNYRQAIDHANGEPDVTSTRDRRSKYGFGLNWEQGLTSTLGIFARAGWNDGHTETWAFTEIDRTLSAGLSLKGTSWRRPDDFAGIGYSFNMLSAEHRDYLANGGYGFIIGDGKLSYAPEQIDELFYSYRVMTGLDATGDYQFIQNPAYNSDRGPVSILSFRLHYEL